MMRREQLTVSKHDLTIVTYISESSFDPRTTVATPEQRFWDIPNNVLGHPEQQRFLGYKRIL